MNGNYADYYAGYAYSDRDILLKYFFKIWNEDDLDNDEADPSCFTELLIS